MPIYNETFPLFEDETVENVFDWIFKNRRGEKVIVNEKPRFERRNKASNKSKLKPRKFIKPKKKPKKKKKKKGLFKRLFGKNN